MKTKTIEHLLQLAKDTDNIHTQNIIDILEKEKERKESNKKVYTFRTKTSKENIDKIKEVHEAAVINYDKGFNDGYSKGLDFSKRLELARTSSLPYPCNIADIAAKMAAVCVEIAAVKREYLKDRFKTTSDELFVEELNKEYWKGYLKVLEDLPLTWSTCARMTPTEKIIIDDKKTFKEMLDKLNAAYEKQCAKEDNERVLNEYKTLKQAEDKYMEELGKKPIGELSIEHIKDYLNRIAKRLCK